jgi:hypothetical protein
MLRNISNHAAVPLCHVSAWQCLDSGAQACFAYPAGHRSPGGSRHSTNASGLCQPSDLSFGGVGMSTTWLWIADTDCNQELHPEHTAHQHANSEPTLTTNHVVVFSEEIPAMGI